MQMGNIIEINALCTDGSPCFLILLTVYHTVIVMLVSIGKIALNQLKREEFRLIPNYS